MYLGGVLIVCKVIWYVILCVECSTLVQPVQKLAENQDYLRTQLFMSVLENNVFVPKFPENPWITSGARFKS